MCEKAGKKHVKFCPFCIMIYTLFNWFLKPTHDKRALAHAL